MPVFVIGAFCWSDDYVNQTLKYGQVLADGPTLAAEFFFFASTHSTLGALCIHTRVSTGQTASSTLGAESSSFLTFEESSQGNTSATIVTATLLIVQVHFDELPWRQVLSAGRAIYSSCRLKS